MKSQPQEFRKAEFSESLQSGELILGASSVIPGFIRENARRNAVSFAPFFVRDCWVSLPNATIRRVSGAASGSVGQTASVCVTLKSADSEQILLDLVGALAYTTTMRSREGAAACSRDEAESGECCRCPHANPFCVDCYLAL